jgi:hypothetical protein
MAQVVAQGSAAFRVRGQGNSGIGVGVVGVRREILQAGVRQVAEAHAFEEGGPTRLIVGTPIHRASHVVVPPVWGRVSSAMSIWL